MAAFLRAGTFRAASAATRFVSAGSGSDSGRGAFTDAASHPSGILSTLLCTRLVEAVAAAASSASLKRRALSTAATAAAALTAASTQNIGATGPLSTAAMLAALAAKRVAGGDLGGLEPSVGCPNIGGG